MNRDLHPTDGARYLLERDRALDGESPDPSARLGAAARYRVAIYTRDAAFTGSAMLGDDGSVELALTGAPAELHARLATIAKLVARDAVKRRGDGMPAWPQRILRWRR
jgi:hypothetical protein